MIEVIERPRVSWPLDQFCEISGDIKNVQLACVQDSWSRSFDFTNDIRRLVAIICIFKHIYEKNSIASTIQYSFPTA